jgi:hypothetical protein
MAHNNADLSSDFISPNCVDSSKMYLFFPTRDHFYFRLCVANVEISAPDSCVQQ